MSSDVKIIDYRTMQDFTPHGFLDITREFWRDYKDSVVEKYDKKGEVVGAVPKPLSVEKFCEYAEISVEVFKYLETQPEYREACEMLKTKIYARAMEGGMLGTYNAVLTQKMMEQHSPKVYNSAPSLGGGSGNSKIIIMQVKTQEQIEVFEKKCLTEDKDDTFNLDADMGSGVQT